MVIFYFIYLVPILFHSMQAVVVLKYPIKNLHKSQHSINSTLRNQLKVTRGYLKLVHG